MLGFKNLFCAQNTLAGIELIRMLRKGKMCYQAGMSKDCYTGNGANDGSSDSTGVCITPLI